MNEPQETGLTITTQSFLSLDKASLTEKAQAVADQYLDGYNSPTEGLTIARKGLDFFEQLKNNLADAAANELKLSKGEKRVINGATVTEQMVGVRWDYKGCGDPLYNDLAEKLKNREAFLQTIKGSQNVLIEETGEVVEIFEPIKSGKMGLIIKY